MSWRRFLAPAVLNSRLSRGYGTRRLSTIRSRPAHDGAHHANLKPAREAQRVRASHRGGGGGGGRVGFFFSCSGLALIAIYVAKEVRVCRGELRVSGGRERQISGSTGQGPLAGAHYIEPGPVRACAAPSSIWQRPF